MGKKIKLLLELVAAFTFAISCGASVNAMYYDTFYDESMMGDNKIDENDKLDHRFIQKFAEDLEKSTQVSIGEMERLGKNYWEYVDYILRRFNGISERYFNRYREKCGTRDGLKDIALRRQFYLSQELNVLRDKLEVRKQNSSMPSTMEYTSIKDYM